MKHGEAGVPGTVEGSKRPNKGDCRGRGRRSVLWFWRRKGSSDRHPPPASPAGVFARPRRPGSYEPGSPRGVATRLGLDRVVKLASTRGLGRFLLRRSNGASARLNRYPDGGAFHLAMHSPIRRRGGERGHRSGRRRRRPLSLATLDPAVEVDGLAVVHQLRPGHAQAGCGAAEGAVGEPLRPGRLLAATVRAPSSSTRHSEQPDGDDDALAARRLLRSRPEHVLTVLDQAYFEYIEQPDYPDGVEEYVKAAGGCSCFAPSRRSTGLPGCGSATGSGRQT